MWRFSKNTVWDTMKNICGDVFRRPFRDENYFNDTNQPLGSWLISGCPFGTKPSWPCKLNSENSVNPV